MSQDIYEHRKKQLFELINVLIHDPESLKGIVENYPKSSFWDKLKVRGQWAHFFLKNRKALPALKAIRSYYYPEALKLFEIFKGERLNSPHPNFSILFLKDPDTHDFLKTHEEILYRCFNEWMPTILSIIPDLEAMQNLMQVFEELKINKVDILKNIGTTLLNTIKTELKNPERILDAVNALVAELSKPLSPLRKNGMLFAKQVKPIVQSFLQEPSREVPNKHMVSFALSFFIKRQNSDFINNISHIAHRSEVDILVLALNTFLMDNKADILYHSALHVNTLKQKNKIIPEGLSTDLFQKIFKILLDLSPDLLPFGVQLAQKVFVDKNQDKILTIIQNIRVLKETHRENDQKLKALMNALFELDIDNHVMRYLPDILEKQAEPLGEVIKALLTQTQKGRAFILYIHNIQTSEILKMICYHRRQVASIVRAYTRGEPWFWHACQLLKDKTVLKLAFQMAMNYIAYKYREHIQFSWIRRLYIGHPMRTLLKSYRPGVNLGDFLREKVRAPHSAVPPVKLA